MNRTGWVFAVVALIVGAGVGVGAIAHVTVSGEGASATTGSTAALAWVPETATIVGQVDFTRLAESDIAGLWLDAFSSPDTAESFDELRERIGIDPTKDLARLTFSVYEPLRGSEDAGDDADADADVDADPDVDTDRDTDTDEPVHSRPWGLVMDGTFDRDGILRKIGEKTETASAVYEGVTVHEIDADADADADDALAIAFPDTGNLLLIGEPGYVRDMIAAGLGRTGSAISSSLMAGWSADAIEGETFWIVGRPASGMTAFLGESGAPELPPLQSFALFGRLSQDLALRARGHASDATAAQQLADVARGFLALGRLSEKTTDELKGVLDTVAIGQVDDEVEVTMTVPHDTLVRFIEQRSADRDR